jgi:hypothetical protein
MVSFRTARWSKAVVSLLATAGLVLAATTVAFAQDPDDPPEDTGVECDAESFVEEESEDEGWDEMKHWHVFHAIARRPA